MHQPAKTGCKSLDTIHKGGCYYYSTSRYQKQGGKTTKQITVTVQHGENFTAAGLMKRYADQTGAEFRRSCWGAAELVIEGKPYRYHHWSITAENGTDTVTLYLEGV